MNSEKKVSNLPVVLCKELANVSSVLGVVTQEAFDREAVVLIDVDYLKIIDSNTTKGMMHSVLSVIIFSVLSEHLH